MFCFHSERKKNSKGNECVCSHFYCFGPDCYKTRESRWYSIRAFFLQIFRGLKEDTACFIVDAHKLIWGSTIFIYCHSRCDKEVYKYLFNTTNICAKEIEIQKSRIGFISSLFAVCFVPKYIHSFV